MNRNRNLLVALRRPRCWVAAGSSTTGDGGAPPVDPNPPVVEPTSPVTSEPLPPEVLARLQYFAAGAPSLLTASGRLTNGKVSQRFQTCVQPPSTTRPAPVT